MLDISTINLCYVFLWFIFHKKSNSVKQKQKKEMIMNPTIETMFDRRTIRKYTDEAVPESTIHELLKVVESTQSWANSQCWEIVRVKDPEIRKALQQTVPSQNPAYTAIVKAPELLVLCARKGVSGTIDSDMVSKHGDWYMYDMGLMTQNFCLAAHSLGLGTVVVGWFQHEKAETVLNAPADIDVVSLVPLGFRNQKGVKPTHKPVESFLYTDGFSN